MKYMTDAMLSGLAKELRAQGIDCETVHMRMLGNERSQESIGDHKILKFLTERKGDVTLITADTKLANYCQEFGVPCIRVQDLVGRSILSKR